MAYNQQPGSTNTIAGGGQYDDLDTVSLLQYNNVAAISAAEANTAKALAEAAQAAALISEGNANTSETNSAASASAALTSENNASTSATNAGTSETNAGTSATNAAASETAALSAKTAAEAAQVSAESLFVQFGDQYLGSKNSAPTVDNSGNPLDEGDVYWDATDNVLKFYTGSAWVAPEDVATTAATNAAASAVSAAASAASSALAAFGDRGTGVNSTYVSSVAVGGTTFAQPAVTGEINSDEGYFVISFAGATNVTVDDLTVNSTYVYIDNTGALQQQVTEPTRQDFSRKVFTMRIAVDTSTNLILSFEYLNNPIGHYANSIRDLYTFLLANGVPFKRNQTITGRAGDLGFDVSSGTLMEFGGTGDIHNANILSFDAVANVEFFLATRTNTDAGGNVNLPKFWDNAGTLTALGSTTVVGHRLYRFSSGNFVMQYGQGNYANITLAKTGAVLENYVLNPVLENATFFGWWFIQSTATNTGGTTLTDFKEYTIGIQGASSSALAGCLLKGNNLSDLLDASDARTNLGLGTAATTAATDYATPADLLVAVPAQTGNSGEFLTTDGTVTSWATVDALPSQTGNDGKYLTTDGAIASWAAAVGGSATATRTVTNTNATEGQTVFSPTNGYTVSNVDVYINGVLLQTSDYTATNGTTITLATATSLDDEFVSVAWEIFETIVIPLQFSFFKSNGVSDPISLVSINKVPFFNYSSVSNNIPITT